MSFWNLSNKLTIFRIGAIPLIAILLIFFPERWPSFAAAAIFLLAAISDALDGHLARRHNTVSDVGKLLDPLADKLLVCTALILLIHLGRVAAGQVSIQCITDGGKQKDGRSGEARPSLREEDE